MGSSLYVYLYTFPATSTRLFINAASSCRVGQKQISDAQLSSRRSALTELCDIVWGIQTQSASLLLPLRPLCPASVGCPFVPQLKVNQVEKCIVGSQIYSCAVWESYLQTGCFVSRWKITGVQRWPCLSLSQSTVVLKTLGGTKAWRAARNVGVAGYVSSLKT